MIIKVILAFAITFIALWFLINRNTYKARAWKKIAMIIFTILAVIVVWFPNTSNTIAHKVGVGRGADLLLYLLALAFIFSTLSLYIKHKEDQRHIVILARRIALIEAKHQKNERLHSKKN